MGSDNPASNERTCWCAHRTAFKPPPTSQQQFPPPHTTVHAGPWWRGPGAGRAASWRASNPAGAPPPHAGRPRRACTAPAVGADIGAAVPWGAGAPPRWGARWGRASRSRTPAPRPVHGGSPGRCDHHDACRHAAPSPQAAPLAAKRQRGENDPSTPTPTPPPRLPTTPARHRSRCGWASGQAAHRVVRAAHRIDQGACRPGWRREANPGAWPLRLPPQQTRAARRSEHARPPVLRTPGRRRHARKPRSRSSRHNPRGPPAPDCELEGTWVPHSGAAHARQQRRRASRAHPGRRQYGAWRGVCGCCCRCTAAAARPGCIAGPQPQPPPPCHQRSARPRRHARCSICGRRCAVPTAAAHRHSQATDASVSFGSGARTVPPVPAARRRQCVRLRSGDLPPATTPTTSAPRSIPAWARGAAVPPVATAAQRRHGQLDMKPRTPPWRAAARWTCVAPSLHHPWPAPAIAGGAPTALLPAPLCGAGAALAPRGRGSMPCQRGDYRRCAPALAAGRLAKSAWSGAGRSVASVQQAR